MKEIPTVKEGITFLVRERPDISTWAEIRHQEDPKNGDLYTIYDISQKSRPVAGSLQYIRGFPRPECISIRHLGIHCDYRGRGVASALLERLRADNPDCSINPGTTTEAGLAFTRHILEHEPEAPKALMPGYVEKTVVYQ